MYWIYQADIILSQHAREGFAVTNLYEVNINLTLTDCVIEHALMFLMAHGRSQLLFRNNTSVSVEGRPRLVSPFFRPCASSLSLGHVPLQRPIAERTDTCAPKT